MSRPGASARGRSRRSTGPGPVRRVGKAQERRARADALDSFFPNPNWSFTRASPGRLITMRSRLALALLLTTAAAEHHCPARTPGDDVANVHINGAAVGCYTGPCERCLVGAEFDKLGEFDAFCDSGDIKPVATIKVTKM